MSPVQRPLLGRRLPMASQSPQSFYPETHAYNQSPPLASSVLHRQQPLTSQPRCSQPPPGRQGWLTNTVDRGLGHAHGSEMVESWAHMGTRQELQTETVDVTVGQPVGDGSWYDSADTGRSMVVSSCACAQGGMARKSLEYMFSGRRGRAARLD